MLCGLSIEQKQQTSTLAWCGAPAPAGTDRAARAACGVFLEWLFVCGWGDVSTAVNCRQRLRDAGQRETWGVMSGRRAPERSTEGKRDVLWTENAMLAVIPVMLMRSLGTALSRRLTPAGQRSGHMGLALRKPSAKTLP